MTTLAEQLEANTAERRKVMPDGAWETIDGSIQARKRQAFSPPSEGWR